MILIKYITTVPKLLDLELFGFPEVDKEQLKFCLKKRIFLMQTTTRANTHTQPRVPPALRGQRHTLNPAGPMRILIQTPPRREVRHLKPPASNNTFYKLQLHFTMILSRHVPNQDLFQSFRALIENQTNISFSNRLSSSTPVTHSWLVHRVWFSLPACEEPHPLSDGDAFQMLAWGACWELLAERSLEANMERAGERELGSCMTFPHTFVRTLG